MRRFIAVRILNFTPRSVEAATTYPAANMATGSFRRVILNQALFCGSTRHGMVYYSELWCRSGAVRSTGAAVATSIVCRSVLAVLFQRSRGFLYSMVSPLLLRDLQ